METRCETRWRRVEPGDAGQWTCGGFEGVLRTCNVFPLPKRLSLYPSFSVSPLAFHSLNTHLHFHSDSPILHKQTHLSDSFNVSLGAAHQPRDEVKLRGASYDSKLTALICPCAGRGVKVARSSPIAEKVCLRWEVLADGCVCRAARRGVCHGRQKVTGWVL